VSEARVLARINMTPDEFWVACRYGERLGLDRLREFVHEFTERNEGYAFDFGEPTDAR
jgi:hypothetical protein